MQVSSYNFDQLADEARNELAKIIAARELLNEDERRRVITVFDAFIQLYNERSNWGYQSTFSLTVNNLPDEIYNNFQVLSKKTGIPTHQLFNILMREFVLNPEKDITADILRPYFSEKARYSINHHKELVITKDELQQLDGPVNFNHIGILKFGSDIDEKLFLDKIHSVNHCKLVDFPSQFSKLLVLMKSKFCDEITFSS